jgi:hypothetical protein
MFRGLRVVRRHYGVQRQAQAHGSSAADELCGGRDAVRGEVVQRPALVLHAPVPPSLHSLEQQCEPRRAHIHPGTGHVDDALPHFRIRRRLQLGVRYGTRGPVAAGGSAIEARRLVSGVSGTRMRPRVGRSRSKVTRSSRVTRLAARRTVITPAEEREVEGKQPEGDGCADHLHRQHCPRYAIVQAGHAHRLHVDHLVEGLDVQARRARGRRRGERLSGEPPELALQPLTVGDSPVGLGAPAPSAREPDARVRVARQQLERTRADRRSVDLNRCEASGVGRLRQDAPVVRRSPPVGALPGFPVSTS